MKINFRSLGAAMLLSVLAVAFTGCSREVKKEDVMAVVVTPLAENLEHLDEYVNLESADLRAYRNYDEIMAYIANHPDVAVTYEVNIGTQIFPGDARELLVDTATASYEAILENLKYLPGVKKLTMPQCLLTMEQITALREAYPNVTIDYTVNLLGNVLTPDTTVLDLSNLDPEQVSRSLQPLSLLCALTEVELMDSNGVSTLSISDVAQLQDAQPNAKFHYTFDLFGKTVSTLDEIVEYNEVPIGNEGEQTIRQALDILDNCTYFKLDDCGLDNEVMAGIREDYPDKKVVWRVHISPFSMLTDETMLRLTHRLYDYKIENLKYLNDVTYLDLGHNPHLTDISFVQYMPKLECVILAGSGVRDISVFSNCPNLVWLEMCYCYNLSDISVLKDHETLKYLNISFTKVSDLSALENVDLDRLNCMGTLVWYEQRIAFTEKHPDCLSVWIGNQPFGYGWRYDDYGYTFFEYYRNMRKVFRYDELDYWGNHKEY